MAYSVFPFKITPGQPLPQVGNGTEIRWDVGKVGFGSCKTRGEKLEDDKDLVRW